MRDNYCVVTTSDQADHPGVSGPFTKAEAEDAYKRLCEQISDDS